MTATAKTDALIEALPWMKRYQGKVMVIKYGGAAMSDDGLRETFAQDVVWLSKVGIRVVLVHGGGKEITEYSSRLGLATRMVNGQRYTDGPTMAVVQMVLCGKTNKDIVTEIQRQGGEAVGLCGIDGHLLSVVRQNGGADLGQVGEVVSVNTQLLSLLLNQGLIPVIAPVGVDARGEVYNVNADHAAAEVAAALPSEKLIYLSDVEGVLREGQLVRSLAPDLALRLIREAVITDGMIPKITSAFKALEAGVRKVHLIDGRVKHSLLLEIFTNEGVGTELLSAKAAS
jgi:acetylglutamate kinase